MRGLFSRCHTSILRLVTSAMPLVLACTAAGAVDVTKLPPAANRSVDFETEIQPILARNCQMCHGAEKQKGGLRLDVKTNAMAGGDSGRAVEPGNSAGSPLIHFVTGLVEDMRMPPKGEPLTREQIGLLRAWIDQGAKWPDRLTSGSGAANYWAFQPLTIATDRSKLRGTSVVDHFVSAKLAEHGLKLSSLADKVTLLRRATFDLHGLPPTPAEIDAFIADKSGGAFARVVDRLLASPRYGERWARHWLDLARFAESDGFEYDRMREHAWRYRDYVIRSFNEDKPYGQFIREQIAGDVLEPAKHDGIAATGFLTAGAFDQAGNTSASALLKARIREEEMEDMIACVGQTFLAITVNCARCHDHKFDPVPQRDYYRMKAALDGVRHGNRPLLTKAEAKEREQRMAEIKENIAVAEKQISTMEREARQKSVQQLPGQSHSAMPSPIAQWSFEGDARDSLRNLDAELLGGAKVTAGRLVLDGKAAFARTAALRASIGEKTLEAILVLADLNQRGGGVMSLETQNGGTFDAIVFGERTPRKWMAGSSFYQRSRDLTGADENAVAGELVHVAIVYRTNNSITVYRNGEAFGETYTPEGVNSRLQGYAAGDGRVLFGLRHTGAGNGFLRGEIEEARLYDRALKPEEIRASASAMGVLTAEQLTRAMTPEQQRKREELRARVVELRAKLKGMPAVEEVYAAVSREPEPTFLLARGDVEQRRDPVRAGGLSVISGLAEFDLPTNAPEAERRVHLAEWLSNPRNPLTWRVMANRVWQHHFGRGLVGTPNDFGVNGERPSHPELLDRLAGELVINGGSLKELHRLILLSATYQQVSAIDSRNAEAEAIDPDNRLLWRYPLRRIEAEAVRDAMLSISGQLNGQMGGPGFRPFKVTVSGSTFYEITDPIGADFNRRSIYRMNVQSGKDPLLDALDCPEPSTKTPVRNTTTTPIQSLALMNNAFVQRQCGHFAERLQREAGAGIQKQVALAYRLTFGREPVAAEARQAGEHVSQFGLESLCWVLLNASEFLYVR